MIEGQAGAYGEIEVTQDMIVAGDHVLSGYVEGYYTPEEILTRLYRTMALARDIGHGEAIRAAPPYGY